MAFVSYFSIANAEANSFLIVKLNSRSKICFIIVIAPTNSFKTLTTQGCLLRSRSFFVIESTSVIVFFDVVFSIRVGKGKIKTSFASS